MKKQRFHMQTPINFSALLLCKVNVLDFFDTGDFFQIFVISRNTEILIEWNYWLGMYVPNILKDALYCYVPIVFRTRIYVN